MFSELHMIKIFSDKYFKRLKTDHMFNTLGFPGGSVVKNSPKSACQARNVGLIPGWERSPGGGHGNTLLYSGLENPVNRGAWWVTVHGVAKSQT